MPPPNDIEFNAVAPEVIVSPDVQNGPHDSVDPSQDSIDLSGDEPVVIKNKEQLTLEKQASSAPSDPAHQLKLKRRLSILVDPEGLSKKGGKKREYQHKAAFVYALLASLSFGSCNLVQGYMSIKYSFKAVYAGFPGMIAVWMMYYIILYMTTRNNPRPSSYRDPITNKLSLQKCLIPVRRGGVNILINVFVMLTFSNSAISGINQGVAASIFSSCIIFVAAYFYFKEGQKLSMWDFIGISMVIACVVIISLSGKAQKEADPKIEVKDTTLEKILTIVFALGTGLLFAINSMEIFACLQLGADGIQMNIDGFLFMGIFMIPFFMYEQINNNMFVFTDILWMGLFVLTVIFGTVTLTKALQIGDAGPIQAIESLKTVWQTIAAIFLFGQVPTPLQAVGCIIGILGVILMVLMKKKST